MIHEIYVTINQWTASILPYFLEGYFLIAWIVVFTIMFKDLAKHVEETKNWRDDDEV